ALEHLVEDPERSSVDVVRADDVVARVEEVDQAVGPREARGEGGAEPCTFQRGEAALQGSTRWVLRPAVFVPLVLAGTGLNVGRREVDRRHDRAGGRVRLLAGVEGEGGDAPCGGDPRTNNPGHVPA